MAISLPTFSLLILFILSVSAEVEPECGECSGGAHPKLPSLPKLPIPPVTIAPKIKIPPVTVAPKIKIPPVVVAPKIKIPPVIVAPKIKIPPVTLPKLPIPPVTGGGGGPKPGGGGGPKPGGGVGPKLPIPPVTIPPITLPPVVIPKLPIIPVIGGSPAPCPPKATTGTCPIDTLKLGACVDLLGGLVHIGVGDSAANACCPVISGLLEVEAAACLCTSLKIKALNLKVYVPIALELLITCGKTPPPGFTCTI